MCEACNEQPRPPQGEEKNGDEEGEESQRAGLDRGLEAIPGQKKRCVVRKLFIQLRIQLQVFHVTHMLKPRMDNAHSSHVTSGAIYAESGPL